MTPETHRLITQVIDADLPFPYYADSESPWLLSRLMPAPTKVSTLRAGPLARLLTRPLVRPVVAACGGTLRPEDLRVVAEAPRLPAEPSRPSTPGLEAAVALPWMDFTVSLGRWGDIQTYDDAQMTRPGLQLVVQLGFPSEHARLLHRYVGRDARHKFECANHPIRRTGPPTLAWARLDLDLELGQCLIEEVQCDWLRAVDWVARRLRTDAPKSKLLQDHEAYRAELTRRYARLWPGALMLAVLRLAVLELGLTDIWMHQPGPGARLKGIDAPPFPPRSLYTDLPKAFCFEPTRETPRFLRLSQGKGPSAASARVRALEVQVAGPLFWRLGL